MLKYKFLNNGQETYPEMISTMKKAKHYIYLETYIFANDHQTREFQQILCQKAKQGIKVVLIYDAVGSIFTSENFWIKLRKAGAQVLIFNPLIFNLLDFQRFRGWHNRDHRKILVIDDKIAFIGGLNISDRYNTEMRDIDIRLEGSIVMRIKDSFLESFRIIKNELYHKKKFILPVLKRQHFLQKHEKYRFIRDIPSYRYQFIRNEYLKMINIARKNIYITDAYFIPDLKLVQALMKATNRKVDVRIIVPKTTDSHLANIASQQTYGRLLKRGVKIYWHQKFMHAKTMTIDNKVVSIGSSNLDPRSLRHNYEANFFAEDQHMAEDLKNIFLKELMVSEKVEYSYWKNRSIWRKFAEILIYLVRDFL